jgi:DNA-binding Lrp family transcriptional regulator
MEVKALLGAYILIKTEMGKATGVIKELAGIEGVKTAHAVTGPYDVIVYAEASDLTALGNLVVSKIQRVAGVRRTMSCLRVEF